MGRWVVTGCLALVVVVIAIVGNLVDVAGGSESPSLGGVVPVDGGTTAEHDGFVTEVDGRLPDGVTVFDDHYPGIANLDPGLLQALRAATAAASDDGVEITINSGWRSPDYQDQLLREAVAAYGSEKKAARWVATSETSPHVAGEAVDVGGAGTTTWLTEHGAAYSLCQIYRNEPWHYELRPAASGHRCGRMYSDPTDDPRLQR